jgi:hypothetical protein
MQKALMYDPRAASKASHGIAGVTVSGMACSKMAIESADISSKQGSTRTPCSSQERLEHIYQTTWRISLDFDTGKHRSTVRLINNGRGRIVCLVVWGGCSGGCINRDIEPTKSKEKKEEEKRLRTRQHLIGPPLEQTAMFIPVQNLSKAAPPFLGIRSESRAACK